MTMQHIRRIAAAGAMVAVVFASGGDRPAAPANNGLRATRGDPSMMEAEGGNSAASSGFSKGSSRPVGPGGLGDTDQPGPDLPDMPGPIGGDRCQMVDCMQVGCDEPYCLKCPQDKPHVYRAEGDCCEQCHATEKTEKPTVPCALVDCPPIGCDDPECLKCPQDKPHVYQAKGDCCEQCHATEKPTGLGTGGTVGNTGATSELACPHKKGSLAEGDMCYKFEEVSNPENFDCKRHCKEGLTCAPKMDAGVGVGFNSYLYCLPLGDTTGGDTGESDAPGDIGGECDGSAGSCQKGLFCKKMAAGSGTCVDRCVLMRCANCKRGICGSQCPCGERCDLGTGPDGKPSRGADGEPTFRPSLIKNAGICMENGQCSAEKRKPECAAEPQCPELKECEAVFPCMCVEERDRKTGCKVSALKCPEAPEGCAAYSVDGCNWCRVTEDGQIDPRQCTKRMCAQDKDDFCSLVGAKRPGCKKCKEGWDLIKGKCYMENDLEKPLPLLELNQVCYRFDQTDDANNLDRKNDCPPCSKCVREPAGGDARDGDAVYKCRALGTQKLEEKCNTENACAPGLHCEAHDTRRAARDLGGEGGISTDPSAGRDIGAGTSTGYEEGQQRCCARKVDGCECLSSKGGSCSPECDHILKPETQCSRTESACNTEAKKAKILECWADGGAAECARDAGWRFDGFDGKVKPGPGLALNKCRRVCEKNGARTMMVADGQGGCKCPSFLSMVNSGTVAKEGEVCTASLWTELKSLKAAYMTKNQCSGMICKPNADNDELVHMVPGAQGCTCPAEDAMDTWERARFCGKRLTCGSAGEDGQRKCEAVQLDEGDCDAEVGCGGAGFRRCIAAPRTGFEIVSGMGKCTDKPEVSQAAPGICKDLCEQMTCPGKCRMGVCSSWKAEKAMPTKPAKEKCNKDAGEIAVKDGFQWTCEQAAKKAMSLRVRGTALKDLSVQDELTLREKLKEGVVESNAAKDVKITDIIDVNLADGSNGFRRAEKSIVATLAFAPTVAVADLKYSETDGVKLSDNKVLQVEDTGTVETAEAFEAAPGSQPTNEPTSAPTGPPAVNVGGSDTTASPPTTTEEFPTVESAAATATATATLLGLSALWW